MAVKVIKRARVYADGYDLSGDHTEVTLTAKVDMLDKTTFNSSSRRRVSGLIDLDMRGQGWYNAANSSGSKTGRADPALWASLGSTAVITAVPSSASPGDIAFIIKGANANYNPFSGGSIGQILPFDFSVVGFGDPLTRGKMLTRTTSLSTSQTGTAVNVGAVSSTQKLYASLHITQVDTSGAGQDVKITIQSASSSGFASPTTQLAFSSSTGTSGQFASTSGAITDTWLRTNITVTSSSAIYSIAVAAGVK